MFDLTKKKKKKKGTFALDGEMDVTKEGSKSTADSAEPEEVNDDRNTEGTPCRQ